MSRSPTYPIRAARAGVAVMLGALIGVTGIGLLGDSWSHGHGVQGSTWTNRHDIRFVSAWTDDEPGTMDPGYDKDVARCEASVEDQGGSVRVVLTNGYPSYTCTFWVTAKNMGVRDLRRLGPEITAPAVLTVVEIDPASACGTLRVGKTEEEAFRIHIEQAAQQTAVYPFTIQKTFREAELGTVGFWKNWDSHKTYARDEIETWLAEIDSTSAWLEGLDTIADMEQVFEAALGKGSTQESRFLAQYLATRLNERSGMLCSNGAHDITGQDPNGYLADELDPQHAFLEEIIQAIEGKFPGGGQVTPTDKQYEIMKDVCDALNNMEI